MPGCGVVGVLVGVMRLASWWLGFVGGCDWFHCPAVCEGGFGCGSVMVGVTLNIGCVCDAM